MASKQCPCCGAEFRPWSTTLPSGKVRICKERPWNKQVFCSIRCAKLTRNAICLPENRAKVSATMKAIGHAPKVRGGNGTTTKHQQMLLEKLGGEWESEVGVRVPEFRELAIARVLKIDVAHRMRKIAIEVDGRSHRMIVRREQDLLKNLYLARRGWCVIHLANHQVEHLCSTCTSADTLLTSLMASLSITAT